MKRKKRTLKDVYKNEWVIYENGRLVIVSDDVVFTEITRAEALDRIKYNNLKKNEEIVWLDDDLLDHVIEKEEDLGRYLTYAICSKNEE